MPQFDTQKMVHALNFKAASGEDMEHLGENDTIFFDEGGNYSCDGVSGGDESKESFGSGVEDR